MAVYKNIPEIELKFKRGTVEKTKIDTSGKCFDVLKHFYDQDTIELTETVIVIFVSRTFDTIGWMKHSTGGTVSAIVDIKLIISTALKCCAQGIFISHNHPSGTLKASREDKVLTENLKKACSFFDMQLYDHLIVTDDKYFSFSDNDLI